MTGSSVSSETRRVKLPGRHNDTDRLAYSLGAATESFVWFFGLEFGARLLRPIFARPAAWRVPDVINGIVVSLLAISLRVRFFAPAQASFLTGAGFAIIEAAATALRPSGR
ncbi:LysE family transporter [Rhizobium sp. WYJ-E13]|nr:LysE family transporter [Rhizobium sp. WYJ-E13]